MSRYLVTGCAGFIGSHLTEALLEAGHEVLGIDAFIDCYPRAEKESNLAVARQYTRFGLLEVDLAEANPRELGEVDGIFHFAAQPGVRTSWDRFEPYARNNVVATQQLLAAAVELGVRVVLASSSSVYGDAEAYPTEEKAVPRPISPYGITKHSCEQLARVYGASFGLDVVTLRYFSVYGPRQRPDMAFARVMSALLGGAPFSLFGSGRQSRDFTYVGDAVAAAVAAFERGPAGAVYNVGGGEEATLRRAVALIEQLVGRTLDVRFERSADGDARRTCADTTRIRRELGWSPTVSLELGLARQLELARSRHRPAVLPA